MCRVLQKFRKVILNASASRGWRKLLGIRESEPENATLSAADGGQEAGLPDTRREQQDDPERHTPRTFMVETSAADNFYKREIFTNLFRFERFALQSQSRAVLDIFARAASMGRFDLYGLIADVESRLADDALVTSAEDTKVNYDPRVMLSLASLLVTSPKSNMDTNSGISFFEFTLALFGTSPFSSEQKLQYVEALGDVRRYIEQQLLIEHLGVEELNPLQVELLHVDRCRHESSIESWLLALNQLYSSLNMSKVGLSEADELPLMDRLVATSDRKIEGPKVSIIMPTFSPGRAIFTALRSLFEQSWSNIDIIVVDDGSSNEYDEIFNEINSLDDRVTVVRQESNAGAYVARNAGLIRAEGEFITIHDDDDWSHPDKIATQAAILLEDSNIVASTTAHVRTAEDMRFTRVNSKARHANKNYSSLMFRRTVVDEIGPWDTVNRGGDSEFESRLVANFGKARKVDLLDKPMSFSRVWSGSLTSGEMARGYFAYSRLLYRSAFRQWQQAQVKTGLQACLVGNEPRPYPVPTTFEPSNRNADLGLFDVIYVSDFYKAGKFVNKITNEIRTASRAGLRVGYMHLDSPETPVRRDIDPTLFELQQGGSVIQVSHDDIAETRLLLVYGTAIGMFIDQVKVRVKSRRGVAIYDELPKLTSAQDRNATSLYQALTNLDHCFKTEFQVVSTSQVLQRRIQKQLPPTRVLDDSCIWRSHLRSEPGSAVTPQTHPVVGFHSFGNRYRWPTNLREYRKIYLSQNFSTKFYGVVSPAVRRFGDAVTVEAIIVNRAEQSTEDFLGSIDFWVYFPHNALVDSEWEPVLAALHAGKVVILPKRLKPLYGDAALYATNSEDVEAIVLRMSRDHSEYMRQARLGLEFMRTHYSEEAFVHRLCELISIRQESIT